MEQALLGAILLDCSCLDEVRDIVSRSDFYHPQHRVIYDACLAVDYEWKPVDLVTVVGKLKATGKLDQAGGIVYVTSLPNSVPSAARAVAYAGEIRKLAIRRELIAAARQIVATAQDIETDLEDVIARSEEALFSVAHRETDDEPQRLVCLVWDRIEYLHSTQHNPTADLVPTGFRELDDLVGGFAPGTLNIVAGRPGMGKSAFAFQLCRQAAERKHTALFVSAEMVANQIADRVLTQEIDKTLVALRRRELDETQWQKARNKTQALGDLPLYVDTAKGLTSERVVSRARRFKSRHGSLGLLAVDYLTHLSDKPSRGESRNDLVGRMARRFKDAAKELNCPVVLLSQLNREAEREKGNKRPTMAQLRDSGEIEAHADLVLLLYRPEYYLPNDPSVAGKVEVIVGKNRQGPTGTVLLRFDAAKTRFSEREWGW